MHAWPFIDPITHAMDTSTVTWWQDNRLTSSYRAACVYYALKIAYYAFWNCSNFVPIMLHFMLFHACTCNNCVTNSTQFNIYFYKAHLFMNLQLPLATYSINSNLPHGSGNAQNLPIAT